MSRAINLSKTSVLKIKKCLDDLDNIDDEFYETFFNIVTKDVRMIKDCGEKPIVDFYCETCTEMLQDYSDDIDDDFIEELKSVTRHKLVDKFVSKESFDNNVDIYFNEVKREYILHPMGESEEMAFVPENRDIFIKNNLKLVIDCAKRYQNLGFPLEDLIQAGNYGLLVAFDRFDTDRANLRFAIVKDIKESGKKTWTLEEAEDLIKRNFKYTKTLDATLKKLPEEGFFSRNEFIEWANNNIKKASFSSIGFAWIRAMILSQLNKMGKIIRVPKSTSPTSQSNTINIIRLDSANPHTDDCYHDNQISDVANEEFAIEDESIENMEKQNMFKDLIEKVLIKLDGIDRRIIKKRFGIGVPFQMSINDIAENEGISVNKVKYSINNSLKIIAANIPAKDKQTIIELLK